MESSRDNQAHPSRTLVVMAKAPRPGAVKTRLAESLHIDAVTQLYRCLLDDTMTMVRSLDAVAVAMMCPAADLEDLIQIAPNDIEVVAQKGEGLAAGLNSVFAHFTALGRHRVIAFNSDSPHLPPSILEGAFEALVTHDVVVGPTDDGGYYLVGANAIHPTLFDSDSMGTKTALDMLLVRADELQLSVAFTDSFYDIDVAGDLTRLASELAKAPAKAPRTAQWLKQWAPAVSHLQTGAAGL